MPISRTAERRKLEFSDLIRAVHGSRGFSEVVAALQNGQSATGAVALPGEVRLGGGMVDVCASDASDPVRVEFDGDTVASIRRFHPEAQRSLGELGSGSVAAAKESGRWAIGDGQQEDHS